MSAPENDPLSVYFNQILDAPADQREALFAKAEAEDAAMAAELRRLVAQFTEEEDSFFEASPFQNMAEMVPKDGWGAALSGNEDDTPTMDMNWDTTAPLPPLKDPERVGAYKIEKKIGEGGMGVVYKARGGTPEREVALKLIHRHKVSPTFLNRFTREYRVLALMNHTNIARIYLADRTLEGDPYFTMEYIDGLPLTEYARTHGLSLQERLRLFNQVCDGVLHAHQKAVVHRDLKPNNILVTEEDGRPVVKLIDFGIAKDISGADDHHTHTGMFMGTPVYMGPEQIEMGAGGADVRSDVYALGVILYELLTGLPPIDPERVNRQSLFDMLRVYKDTVPPRPSQRLSQSPSEEAIQDFHLELRGDLDWVVMKAMAKQIDSRYQSPAELKADLDAFLDGRVISARPPTFSYHLARFIQRNKLLVGATLLVVSALITALLVTTRAQQETERALNRARATNAFLIDTFSAPDPKNIGVNAKVIDLIQGVETKLAESTDPLFEAEMRSTLGNTYYGLDQYDIALSQHRIAHALYLKERGEHSADTLRAQYYISRCMRRLRQYEEAMTLAVETADLQRHYLSEIHTDHILTLENIAIMYINTEKYEEALERYQKILFLLDQNPRANLQYRGRILNGLAICQDYLSRFLEAEQTFTLALKELRENRGEGHPETLSALNNYSNLLLDMGRYNQAVEYAELLARRRLEVYGATHTSTISADYSFGRALIYQGRMERAGDVLGKVLEYRMDRYGLENMGSIRTLMLYLWAESASDPSFLNQVDDLVDTFMQSEVDIPDYAYLWFGTLYFLNGDMEQAFAFTHQGIDPVGKDGFIDRHLGNMLMGRLFRKQGDHQRALYHFNCALEVAAPYGPSSRTAEANLFLGLSLLDSGRDEDAMPYLREARRFQDRIPLVWEVEKALLTEKMQP